MCQHDCSTQNSPGRKFIEKLLLDEGKTTAEVKDIISTLADYSKRLKGEPLKVVNQVLTKNKAVVDEFDQKHILSSVNHTYNRVSLLSGDLGSRVRDSILSDPRAFLQLVDYHNQLDFTPGQKLEKFLSGKLEVDGKLVDVSQPNLLPEIRRFINNGTKWGRSVDGIRDCARRQGNIDRLTLPAGGGQPAPTTGSSTSSLAHLAPVNVAPRVTMFSLAPPPPPTPVQVNMTPATVGGAPGVGVQATHTATGTTVGGAVTPNGEWQATVTVPIPIPCVIL